MGKYAEGIDKETLAKRERAHERLKQEFTEELTGLYTSENQFEDGGWKEQWSNRFEEVSMLLIALDLVKAEYRRGQATARPSDAIRRPGRYRWQVCQRSADRELLVVDRQEGECGGDDVGASEEGRRDLWCWVLSGV